MADFAVGLPVFASRYAPAATATSPIPQPPVTLSATPSIASCSIRFSSQLASEAVPRLLQHGNVRLPWRPTCPNDTDVNNVNARSTEGKLARLTPVVTPENIPFSP